MYYYLINHKCYWTNNKLTLTVQEDSELFKVWRKKLRRLQVEATDRIDLEIFLYDRHRLNNGLTPIDFTDLMLQVPNLDTCS